MLGQTLSGRYKLTRILGAGGFGQTYLAVDVQQTHNPRCVVKQLKPASQDASFLGVARRLFETEVKILGELGDHDHIPRLLDSFEEDNEFYLVQEYIDGESLEDEIKRAGKLSEAEVITLLESVLPVLEFIHGHHVVHRDLKPDNLIRRRDNGELVLIDFGAVKEIRTRLITGEQTALTIGIGTQGYTPSEQLSGKPRYSSDIYALGMTAIHALTGRSPTDLPEDLGSLDPIWQEYAAVSPGLAIVLGKMTRHYIYQRYASADVVLADLGRLDELPHEAAEADTYLETAIPQNGRGSIMLWRMGKRAKLLTVAIATIATSAVVLGLRQVGMFVPLERRLHDRLVSVQPDLGPDPRLLIVGVGEADVRSLSLPTPSDEQVAQVIENLQAHQPASIGVDLLRDIPVAPGREQFLESIQDPNVVVVTKLGDGDGENMVPPPSGLTYEQISFNNIVRDPDFRVRRALLLEFLEDEILQAPGNERLTSDIDNDLSLDPADYPVYSLGLELATRYLYQYAGILPDESDTLQMNGVRFEPIDPTFGGYQRAETTGYQLFMRYRSPQNVATQLSFVDVLNNNFDPALVKDKIVFIGSTAGSSRDLFLTPFNLGGDNREMPGVVLHAQVASQILSSVLEGEPLPWAWPDWAEIVWIVALTGIGATFMVLTQRGPVLIALGAGGLIVTAFVSVACFQLGGWVPVAAPLAAFFLSASGARISKSYQRRHWEALQLEAATQLEVAS
ncbi:MAG: CHASE2 domain-containing protein [Cyanobacteria bacterium P01_F01_bin.53]